MSTHLSKSQSSAEEKPEQASNRILAAVGRTILTGSAHFLAFTLVLLVLCGPVLVFADMYVEKGSKIPVLTVLIVHHARWMSYYGWVLLYFPAVVLNAILLFALNMLPANWRWIPRCYSSFVLLAALFYISIAFSAMSVPQQFESKLNEPSEHASKNDVPHLDH